VRIVSFSDYHNSGKIDIPDGDVLIIAGDSSHFGKLDDFEELISSLPHKHRLLIGGNHDSPFLNGEAKEIAPSMTYLEDDFVVIDGLKFYGAPWHSVVGMTFGLSDMEMSSKWNKIPDDTDVLITHMPPYGTLDGSGPDSHWGCVNLASRVFEIKPRVHIFGHLHCAHGRHKHNGTEYVNVALTNNHYEIIHEPTIIDL